MAIRAICPEGLIRDKQIVTVSSPLWAFFGSNTDNKDLSSVIQLLACQCRRHRRCGFDPWVGNTLREGNDNPLQYSCLGNPMDRGAWWATIHGVAESDATEHACRWVGVPTSQSDGT